MKPLPVRALVVWALATLAAAGCALTNKSDPLVPRYFSPERSGETLRTAAKSSTPPAELRLGRIEGASYLEERLIFRTSGNELGYYAERRWTEAPEEYLKRRLTRVLFEERGLRHVVGGNAATLDVQLTAFEEVRVPTRLARVRMSATLHDQRLVLWEETVTVELPVPPSHGGDPADAVVEALGEALRIAVDRVADRVGNEISSTAAAPPVKASGVATQSP